MPRCMRAKLPCSPWTSKGTRALANVRLQREPIDLLLLARAAVAANDDEGRSELQALIQRTGLRDARIDAVL